DFYEKNADAQEKTFFFSTKAPQKYTDITYPDGVYLMFGKESKGLPESLLHDNPQTTVRIPMRDKLRSLNLSNSVAIAVYEVFRQRDFSELKEQGELTQYSWDS
ncbi:MAG: tRNA (uridine(34)/cytosine(34)/5-carboxymethylaminomethyluridine(34)-2'-O)-methyltransferase TrmL, partial [Clostridia bacterium]|nr:tRNA (uridine(34)/cytosine(34)/5-carboxymethylaminomethyluridine(34)-2'-O)-methyltransferase TrmL [Clostridia bacterium]